MRRYATMQERIIANSIISECWFDGSPCWDWIGQRGTTNDAYPQLCVRVDGKVKTLRAHRVSFETFSGIIIPPSETIDHLCQRVVCVAPLHLESVTQQENRRRVDERRSPPIESLFALHGIQSWDQARGLQGDAYIAFWGDCYHYAN